MRRTRQAPAALAVSITALAMIIGCGGDGGPTTPKAGSIAISPRSLSLTVGARGSLTTTVKTSAGAVITNASVTWVSRAPAIATVDRSGSVAALAAGTTTVVATSSGVSDSVSVIVTADLQLTVTPNAATVTVARTQPFTVVARNSSGQLLTAPAVTWTSSNPTVATVSSSGIATGVAKGTTSITAKAAAVTSAPATLTVTESCSGILATNTFQGTLDYDWLAVGTTGDRFVIHSEYRGSLKATLTRVSTTPTQATWTGDVTGTASLEETKADPTTPGTTSALQGDGAIVALAGGSPPKMTLIVNLQTCTYELDAIATLNAVRTEPDGSTSRSNISVASLHARVGRPLTTISKVFPEDGKFDGHSQTWSGLNPAQDAFIPLGLGVELMGRSPTEPPIGRAGVSWVLLPK